MKPAPYKFMVRLPPEMRDRIAEAAALYRRSMNSEIVARLEQAYMGLPAEHTNGAGHSATQPHIEARFRRTLTEEEERLLNAFRRLNAERQRALLELLS